MGKHDVIVIGGGISGLSFAFHAARAGRSVLVLERAERLGGCLHSARDASGFWFELGAHTCYNSYGAFLELLEGLELLGQLQARGKPVLRFLDGNRIAPGQNLGALLRRMSLWELAVSLPRLIGASQEGKSVEAYYSRLVGTGNYRKVLGPMLSAVPSQSADAFPADMLFKRRARRKDVIRSFTLPGGLGSLAERIVALPGVTSRVGQGAARLERLGDGFAVTLDDGAREEAGMIAVATPPAAAAALVGNVAADVAERLLPLRQATVETLGVVVRAANVTLPYSTFLIPLGDVFHSVVTRDVVPDPEWRGFSFHFKPGQSREAKLLRACAVLGVERGQLEFLAERTTVLPSPEVGHHEAIRAVDRLLDGQRLALTGNWFAGLSIEDCVQRSRSEWRRVSGAQRQGDV